MASKLKKMTFRQKLELKAKLERKKELEIHKAELARVKKIINIPTKLLDHGSAVFTDRIGNILNRGDMICYISGSKFKIGVFIGLVERLNEPSVWKYYNKPNKIPEIIIQVAVSILDIKGRERRYYSDFDFEKNKDGYSFQNYIVIQKPEFKVGEKDIGRCFSLIDDLKDGILKEYCEEINEFDDII